MSQLEHLPKVLPSREWWFAADLSVSFFYLLDLQEKYMILVFLVYSLQCSLNHHPSPKVLPGGCSSFFSCCWHQSQSCHLAARSLDKAEATRHGQTAWKLLRYMLVGVLVEVVGALAHAEQLDIKTWMDGEGQGMRWGDVQGILITFRSHQACTQLETDSVPADFHLLLCDWPKEREHHCCLSHNDASLLFSSLICLVKVKVQ